MAVEASTRINYGDSGVWLAEVGDSKRSADELLIAATGIHSVLMSSWQKFVDGGTLTAEGLRRKIRQPEAQAEHMVKSKARYMLLYEGDYVLESDEQVKAFARIENYRPLLGRSYPNFSDLEVRSGDLMSEEGARDARTLLYHGARRYAMQCKAAAYTEEPNSRGRQFFQEHGFEQLRILPPEVIDVNSGIQYVHVEAPSIGGIYQTFPTGEHRFTHR